MPVDLISSLALFPQTKYEQLPTNIQIIPNVGYMVAANQTEQMPLSDYINTLSLDGTLVQVGAPEGPLPLQIFNIIPGRRSIAGSAIGSPKEIREMFQLAVDQKIKPWVEKRPMKDANQAIVDMEAGKARFRYVLQN